MRRGVADQANTMACHQHRCCRRPVSGAGGVDLKSLDYVLLAAHDPNVIEGAATLLRGFGASPERHELGLRLNCRGENWQAALAHLSDTLAAPARRGLRVALIPIAAEATAFHKALLMSQPLDGFAPSLPAARPPAPAVTKNPDTAYLGDVFKGESLE